MKTEYPLNGNQTRFRFEWPYLSRSHIVVLLDDRPKSFTWVDDHEVEVLTSTGRPVVGTTLVILRVTPDLESYAAIPDAGALTAEQLNQMRLQLLYLIQERAGGMAGYIGAAVGAVTGELQGITDDIRSVQDMLDILSSNLVTLNELRADVLFAKNEAQALRDELLAEINSTAGKLLELKTALTELSVGQEDFGARVSNEAITRLNEDSALAATIESLEATVTTDRATINATITEVNQARADGDAALAQRIVSLEAREDTTDTAALTALINEESAVRLASDVAQAAQTLTLQAAIGGAQLVKNGKMIPGGPPLGGLTFMSRTAAGVPQGAPSAYVGRGNGRDMMDDPFEVTVGESIDLSVWVGLAAPLPTSVGMVIFLRNAAGEVFSAFGFGYISANFTGWRPTSGNGFIVPAGTVTMQCGVWIDQAAGGGVAHFANFSVTRHSSALAQVEQQTAATVSRLGTVESNYTLKAVARSDGKVAMAGIGLAATAGGDGVTQSEIILMADRILGVLPDNVNGTPAALFAAGVVDGIPTVVIPTARIGDGTLDTLKLAGNAVTLPVTGALAVATAVPNNPTHATMAAAAINSLGQPVRIEARTCAAFPLSQGETSYVWGIYRDSTLLASGVVSIRNVTTGPPTMYQYDSFSVTDASPGAGSHTYTLQCWSATTAATATMQPSLTNLFLLGLKR